MEVVSVAADRANVFVVSAVVVAHALASVPVSAEAVEDATAFPPAAAAHYALYVELSVVSVHLS